MRLGLPALAALLVLAAAGGAADTPKDHARSLEKHMRQVIDAAEPSVVAVLVSHKKYPPLPPAERNVPGKLGGYTPPMERRGPFFQPKVDRSLDLSDPENIADNQYGSGLVLSAGDGLVLTSYHLIDGATKVYVRGAAGRGSYADIHAADARSDLAVLRLIDPVPGLKDARFADVRVHPGPNGEAPTVARGMWVIAMGHPLALGFVDGEPSASWGILSNVRRRAAGPGREENRTRALHHYGTLLQTDARIALGCSGGTLLNMDGEVIGMTSALAAVTGTDTAGGFAVPFDTNYRRIVEVLRQGKEVEYGFLGVSVDPTQGERVGPGLPISRVSPGTPAADADLRGGVGLASGDVIVAIDGKPVRETDDLFLHVGSALAGETVKITYERAGRPLTRDVKLAKFPHAMPGLASVKPKAVFGVRVEYTSVLLTQDRGASDQGLPPGVLIRDVEPDSPAAEKLKPLGEVAGQWIVTRVDNQLVRTPVEFYKETQNKKSVTLELFNPQPNIPTRTQTVRLP